jgi:hypothetical protein
MTPEEQRQRDLNELRAVLVSKDPSLIIAALTSGLYDEDTLLRFVVELKRHLSAPVEPGEIPGHGVWKPRAQDPELTEVTCTDMHGDKRTRVPHTHIKKVGKEVLPGLHPLEDL